MSFSDFIKEQNSEENLRKEKMREERISRFKKNISQLFLDIEQKWLKEYIERDLVKLNRETIVIIEEKLGEYQVEKLCVKIANKEVALIPRGTDMVGTDARIDVVYLGITRALLIRAGEKVRNSMQMINVKLYAKTPRKREDSGMLEWKVVKNNDRRILIKLTKESFEDMLMSVVHNG